MGIIAFAIKMLQKDIKQSVFYLGSMIFSIAIVFNDFNLLFNEDFVDKKDMATYYTFSAIALIVLLVSLLFIALANLYFIYGKTKELAIAVISGRSVFAVGLILAIQNLLLGIVGIIIGLAIGFMIMPIINNIVYDFIGGEVRQGALSIDGLTITLSIVVLQLIIMVIIDMGYTYRREIIDLLKEQNNMYARDNRKMKIPSLIYWILYFIPIMIVFSPINIVDKAQLLVMAQLIAIPGMIGIVNVSLPKLILKIKEKYFYDDKIKLLAFSNLHYSLRKSNYLIVTLILSVTSLIFIFSIDGISQEIKVITMISYLVVICIMAITIVYKMLIEGVNRKKMFTQLKLVGYINKEINKILTLETLLLYFVIIFIPLIQILIIIICNVLAGGMDLPSSITIVFTYLGTFIISLIISLLGYRKIVFNSIKEGI
jgi:putative ABC transport system permease protein